MKNICTLKVIIHSKEIMASKNVISKINKYHTDLIERKLNDNDLAAFSIEEKCLVLDNILEDLKSRDENGVII